MKFSFYLNAFVTVLSFVAKPTSSWKLKLCVNGSSYETNSDDCKYGFWFKEPTVVHKICFEHGVWAIYKEFCEESPVIWTVRPGTKGCMTHDQLGKRIVGAVAIGEYENSGAVVSTSHRRLFFSNHKLKHGMRVSFVNSPATVEVLTWGPPHTKFSLQQYINNERGVLQQCLIKGEHAFFGYYRIRVESPKNASFYLSKNVCYTPLSRQTGDGGKRVQVLSTEIDFDILQNTIEFEDEDEFMNCKQSAKIDDQFEGDVDELTSLLARTNGSLPDQSSVHLIEQRVNQETHKIALKLIGHHFRNDTFDGKFATWEFLNVAKEIFLNACPKTMVPEFFVEQLYILFQALLHESFLQFPNHQDRDQDTTKRILHSLQECLKNSSELEFKAGKNCTDDAPLLRKQFKNGTDYHLLVEMPSFIKVDGVNYDLLMESIWKLMNFAHYYCSDYFQELASDHSVLEGHWYKLFSPLVIRRWKYPGRGYLIFQKIFMSINLENSIRNLDFCVSAARLHSSYKGWLKRPLTHEDNRNSKKQDKKLDRRDASGRKQDRVQLWDDIAFCMKDYTDPALKMAVGNNIEKCGIRAPQLPFHPFMFDNSRGNRRL